jgi:hypothetical protein
MAILLIVSALILVLIIWVIRHDRDIQIDNAKKHNIFGLSPSFSRYFYVVNASHKKRRFVVLIYQAGGNCVIEHVGLGLLDPYRVIKGAKASEINNDLALLIPNGAMFGEYPRLWE